MFQETGKGNVSLDEHRIPEGKETIPFPYRRLIGVQDVFFSGEGRNQHQQGGFRKMEIGNQAVKDFKAVAGINEDVRPAASGPDDAVFISGRFQRAAACSPDGDNASSGGFCIIDQLRLGFLYDIEL